MLTDTERRMLQEKGLGEKWYTLPPDRRKELIEDPNRTFTSAQDYEDLLEKVVRPNKKKFSDFMWNMWISNWENTDTEDFFSWFLTLSIEERCKLIHDFGVEVLGWK